ncbi:MAG: ATP-binding cassette domain-containing protein, partial [Alphaproteobacteria bacterium]|nr:ATP-binding cassette domain-containing protein [Alphaproteobacteria bacterium]
MPTHEDGALELRDVSLSIKGAQLFSPLSIAVHSGHATTVMGPSGCGKSSLLAYICGTLEPVFETRGEVRLSGTDITPLPPEERHVGILFQNDLLFPHLSVGDNLAFGLPPEIRGRDQRRKQIEDALTDADLGGMSDRDPATLSGGQRARVALMRTILSGPRALLLDEPFSKLD